MSTEPVKDSRDALEQQVGRMLSGTAQYSAPAELEAQVWSRIEQSAKVRWWQRRVPEWPVFAQLLFAATGVAAAALLVLARPASPSRLSAVIGHPVNALQRPAADLHTTLDLLSVFHRLTGTLAGSLPDLVWYGGIVLCGAAYVALFFLVVFGYRLLQAPLASR